MTLLEKTNPFQADISEAKKALLEKKRIRITKMSKALIRYALLMEDYAKTGFTEGDFNETTNIEQCFDASLRIFSTCGGSEQKRTLKVKAINTCLLFDLTTKEDLLTKPITDPRDLGERTVDCGLE